MKGRFVGLIILFFLTSCGLMGLYQTDHVNHDPEYQRQALANLESKPIAKQMDSLIREIDSAKEIIPSDLSQTTLICETFIYEDYLRTFENKFVPPLKDTKKRRRQFKRYAEKGHVLVKRPKYNIVYVNKGEYENYDFKKYKYVLKTTSRLDYDPNQIYVTNDGGVYPLITTVIYYIYDRESKKVFGEIKELSILEKDK